MQVQSGGGGAEMGVTLHSYFRKKLNQKEFILWCWNWYFDVSTVSPRFYISIAKAFSPTGQAKFRLY